MHGTQSHSEGGSYRFVVECDFEQMAGKQFVDDTVHTITCDCGNGDADRFFETRAGQFQCRECGSRYDQLYVVLDSVNFDSGDENNAVLPLCSDKDLSAFYRPPSPASSRRHGRVAARGRNSYDGGRVSPVLSTVAQTIDELRCKKCSNDVAVGFFINDAGLWQCGACDTLVAEATDTGTCFSYQENSHSDYDDFSGNPYNSGARPKGGPVVSLHDQSRATCTSPHEKGRLHLLSFDHETKVKQLMCPSYLDGCSHVMEERGSTLNSRTDPTDRTRVTVKFLHRLQAGDHICFYRRLWNYWHHALVVCVDLDCSTVWLIHYSNDGNEAVRSVANSMSAVERPYIASVRSDFVKVTHDEILYRIDYDPNDCFPPALVMHRASERMGERKYHPLKNNCEHFARECKQEARISKQADDFKCSLVDTYKKTIPSDAVQKGVKAFVDFLKAKDPQALMKEFRKLGHPEPSPKNIPNNLMKLAEKIGEKWKLYHDGSMPAEEFVNYVGQMLGDAIFTLFPAITNNLLARMVAAITLGPTACAVLVTLKGLLGPFVGPPLVRLLVYMTFVVVKKMAKPLAQRRAQRSALMWKK